MEIFSEDGAPLYALVNWGFLFIETYVTVAISDLTKWWIDRCNKVTKFRQLHNNVAPPFTRVMLARWCVIEYKLVLVLWNTFSIGFRSDDFRFKSWSVVRTIYIFSLESFINMFNFLKYLKIFLFHFQNKSCFFQRFQLIQ